MTTLRLITPPIVEPVSMATIKSYLRIDHDDDDAMLSLLISAARETGEELSHRAFITQTLEMTVDAFPDDDVLRIMRPRLSSVTSVKYKDDAGVEATWTDYVVDTNSEPGRILFNSLPSASLQETGAVTVRYVAGYGSSEASVPDSIKKAILALVSFWYENREITYVPVEIRKAFVAAR